MQKRPDTQFQPADAQPNQPDMPEPRSPMFDPPEDRKFIASPEEWLESDPPRHAPAPDLTPGATYAWRSSEGLRFSYTVPIDFKPDDGADLVIICHPRNSDFRWGMGNHLSLKAAEERGSARLAFRPTNIVVSLDGINADPAHPKQRWFACDVASAVRFRDFVLELTRTFPARRLYLYGMGGGAHQTGESGDEEGCLLYTSPSPRD